MLDDYKIEWNRLNFDQNETHNLSPLLDSFNRTVLFMRPTPRLAGPKATIETINTMTILDMANRSGLLRAARMREINSPYGLIGKGNSKYTKGAWLIGVGEKISEREAKSIKSHVFKFAHMPDLFIKAWYFAAKKPNSPLEIHYSWNPKSESQMAILGYENAWTTEDNAAAAKMIRAQEIKLGAPEGPRPARAKFEHMRRYYEMRHAQGYSQEQIAEELEITDKTLRNYIKIWKKESG